MNAARTQMAAWAAMGLLHWLISAEAFAALQITPPQLTPDSDGMIATEVRSSLASSSRWSVRMIPWDPNAQELDANATLIADAAPHVHPLGVDISPRFFSLAASGRQVVRARIRDRFRQYRLLIEQIPDDDPQGQGVNFRFRFSLPVYRSSTASPVELRSISIH